MAPWRPTSVSTVATSGRPTPSPPRRSGTGKAVTPPATKRIPRIVPIQHRCDHIGDGQLGSGVRSKSISDAAGRLAGVVDLPVLDAVEPARPQPLGLRHGLEVRHVVGHGVEYQVDRHPGQVGADAIMRTGAAESDVGIRVAQDVERVRVVEDLFVEVGRAVRHHQPLALLDPAHRPARCPRWRCAGTPTPASPTGRSRRRPSTGVPSCTAPTDPGCSRTRSSRA